ncbi:hypothetical protein QR680_018454 [Steinernema hermaphroditum]|uniref:Dynein light chain n=1 Tax=Steinernema hermaphroditum TaxID=289476 RepID=A0AA39HIY2_9BILA|nr:hypothetical protein QR680_018454 [Steinernema hermaphroditum]
MAKNHNKAHLKRDSKLNLENLKFDTKMKVVVKASEIPVEMIEHAVWLADEAARQHMDDGDIAMHIKKGFDSFYTAPWHCIVGRRFSSLVTHEDGSFLHFYMGKIAVVLFKCKD